MKIYYFYQKCFYSTLALNNIIEKNLRNNNAKILKYFEIIENLKKKDQKDLINFKKALYLIKISEIDRR